MVDGNVEETLNLVSVEVHRDQTIDTGNAQQVGNKFGPNANAGFVFAVLSCPSEVRDNGVNGSCRSPLGSVNHQEQLHKIV